MVDDAKPAGPRDVDGGLPGATGSIPRSATLPLALGELRTRVLRRHWPSVRVRFEVVDDEGAVIHRSTYRARRGTTASGALADVALDLLDDAQRAVFIRQRPEVDRWARAHRDELIAFVVDHGTSAGAGGDPQR